jgi:hypothetical protein
MKGAEEWTGDELKNGVEWRMENGEKRKEKGKEEGSQVRRGETGCMACK